MYSLRNARDLFQSFIHKVVLSLKKRYFQAACKNFVHDLDSPRHL